ncbi:ABC transporter permease [Amycolatopsis sp. GM8]|uniref:ABC transporter permease n=1 Tax=Amycolatopsis sp. GM8 TaxID=2896530 RepID=UPI001F2E0315|nr:ABC transporter permease [Amycolatopsis sp. GM8]
MCVAGAYGLGSWAVVIALWELAARWGWLKESIFPPPSHFLSYLINDGIQIGVGPDAPTLVDATLATFARVGAGLAIGIVAATAIGVTASVIPPARRAVMPIVRVLAPVAPIAWIPLGLSLFGIGDGTAVFIVTLGVVFTLTVATVAAIDDVNPELLKTARSLGSNSVHLWANVILPAAAPQVFTMVRLNFFAAWMAVLAAEMVGLRSGLGAAIIIGREQFNADLVLIGIMVIGLCGFAADSLLVLIQKRVLWWGKQS